MYYVRIAHPETQESPMYLDCCYNGRLNFEGTCYEGLTITGNDRFYGYKDPLFEKVENALENDLYSIVYEWDYEAQWYKNFSAAICEVLAPEKKNGHNYSTREIKAIKDLTVKYHSDCRYTSDYYDVICDVMTIVSGRKYDHQGIHGCCQGDYQEVFYEVEKWNQEAIDWIEAEYFNTGTEFCVHDEDTIPEDASDVSGYWDYTPDWNVRRGIANAIGCNEDEVFIYNYDGTEDDDNPDDTAARQAQEAENYLENLSITFTPAYKA